MTSKNYKQLYDCTFGQFNSLKVGGVINIDNEAKAKGVIILTYLFFLIECKRHPKKDISQGDVIKLGYILYECKDKIVIETKNIIIKFYDEVFAPDSTKVYRELEQNNDYMMQAYMLIQDFAYYKIGDSDLETRLDGKIEQMSELLNSVRLKMSIDDKPYGPILKRMIKQGLVCESIYAKNKYNTTKGATYDQVRKVIKDSKTGWSLKELYNTGLFVTKSGHSYKNFKSFENILLQRN